MFFIIPHFSSNDLQTIGDGFCLGSRITQSERPTTGSFFPVSDTENTTWLGLPKSISFGNIRSHELTRNSDFPTVSSNINEFMDTIDCDGEDDIFF